MGWTDLFKGKSKLKTDGALRWFGKLSTYKDYFNSKVDEEWVAEFNEWLMKGFEQYHARASSMPAAAAADPTIPDSSDGSSVGAAARKTKHRILPMATCILRLPKSGMTVLASIQDYGGDSFGRPFPLSFYVGLPTAAWPGPQADALAAAFPVLSRLLSLRDDVARFERTPSRFDTAFGDRDLSLDALENGVASSEWRKAAAGVDSTSWFEAVKPLLTTPEWPAWAGLLNRWGELIVSMEGNSFEATLSFPLAGPVERAPQICGWLAWLGKRIDLSNRAVSLLWTEGLGPTPARFSVVIRDLMPDDYLLVTPLASGLSFVDSACTLKPAADGTGSSAAGPATFADLTAGSFVAAGG